jgi:medium-chain acyl-[acyl-carrier-protein] hydrolase
MSELVPVYEKLVLINSRDVDGKGHCRASALLCYLQDASAEHSTLCGCGRKELLEQFNVFWMLTRIRVELHRPIRWLEELTIRTWHRGGKGILVYRDYDLLVGDELVGEATALWVLPDMVTRKLLNTRLVQVPALAETANGLPPKACKLTALHAPENLTEQEKRPMRYSDTDVNGHVNNTRYADFCCDAAQMERLPGSAYLSSLEITYHEECMAGEILTISKANADGALYVHGAGADGDARFDGKMTFRV